MEQHLLDSHEAPTYATCETARRSTRSSSSASSPRRQKRNGDAFLKLQLGDCHGPRRGRGLGRRRRDRALRRSRAWSSRPRAATRSTSATAPASRCAAMRAAAEAEYDLGRPGRGAAHPLREDGRRPAGADRHRPAAAPARAARPPARPGHGDRAPLAPGAGRQALPPGLPPRPARALPLGRPGRRARWPPTFPGIDRDVAVTGALLHDIGKIEAYADDGRRDRAHRRRQAARRDPARLLPRAPRDRAHRRLPRGLRPGGAAHRALATTASSSTAAPWSRARARPRSST